MLFHLDACIVNKGERDLQIHFYLLWFYVLSTRGVWSCCFSGRAVPTRGRVREFCAFSASLHSLHVFRGSACLQGEFCFEL